MKIVVVGYDLFYLIENFCKWLFIEIFIFLGCINIFVVRKNVIFYKIVELMLVIGKLFYSFVCIKFWLSYFFILLLFLYILVILEFIFFLIFVFNMWLEGDIELI